jgi:hypothetical protein
MPNQYDFRSDIGDPADIVAKGFVQGQSIAESIRKSQLEQAQQEQLQKRAEELHNDLGSLATKPSISANDVVKLQLAYPEMAEKFKAPYEALNDQEKQSVMSNAIQVKSALDSGQHDIAAKVLQDQVTALKNSGQDDKAKPYQNLIDSIKHDQETGQHTANLSASMFLSAAMGKENFSKTFATNQEQARLDQAQPLELARKGAEAISAQTGATYAEPLAQANLGKAQAEAQTKQAEAVVSADKYQLDVEKIASDIANSQADSRLKTMQNIYEREQNPLKKQKLQLEIDKAQTENQTASIKKADKIKGDVDHLNLALNMVDEALTSPALKGSGPIMRMANGWFPGKAHDLIEKLQTIGSDTFISKIESVPGMSPMSDGDRKEIKDSVRSLDYKQSNVEIEKNLNTIRRIFAKKRDEVINNYGLKGTPIEQGDFVLPGNKRFGAVTQKGLEAMAAKQGISPGELKAWMESQ